MNEIVERQERVAHHLAWWIAERSASVSDFCCRSVAYHAWGGARYIEYLYGGEHAFRAWKAHALQLLASQAVQR